MSLFLAGRGGGGGDGKDGVGSEAGNCCSGICVMVSWLRVGGWYMYCRQRDKYKTKGRSKIKTANIKEIPRISPCDVDCGVIVGLDCR